MVRRVFALVLIVSGVLLLAVPTGWWLLHQRGSLPKALDMPAQVAGLSLVEQVHGGDAIDEINRLHGLDFRLAAGAVGIYGDGRGATLWVSQADDARLAGQLMEEMRLRIAEGRSPFTSLGERLVDQTRVYELVGLGQRHFYFQAEELVIWLAVNEGVAETALRELLAFYR